MWLFSKPKPRQDLHRPGYKEVEEVELEVIRKPDVELCEFKTLPVNLSPVVDGSQTRRASDSGSEDIAFIAEKDVVKTFYVKLINRALRDDAELQSVLPLGPLSADLFEQSWDGVLLCKLLNAFFPEAVDERALNTSAGGSASLSYVQLRENNQLCINTAKALGCIIKGYTASDIVKKDRNAILSLLGEIVKRGQLKYVDPGLHPQLRWLLEKGELGSVSSEQLLLRWLNHHLNKVKGLHVALPIESLEGLALDPHDLLILLGQVFPGSQQQLEEHRDSDPVSQARCVVDVMVAQQCPCDFYPAHVLAGLPLVQLYILTTLLHARPDAGLEDLGRRGDVFPAEATAFSSTPEYLCYVDHLDEDNASISREERTLRMWVNSLAAGRLACSSLFSDQVRNGWLLLEALDILEPGCVDWKLASQPPFKEVVRRIKSMENCSLVVQVCNSRLCLPLVGIGGEDIVEGRRKAILSVVWQLMRFHTMQLLTSILEGADDDDSQPGTPMSQPSTPTTPSSWRHTVGGCHPCCQGTEHHLEGPKAEGMSPQCLGAEPVEKVKPITEGEMVFAQPVTRSTKLLKLPHAHTMPPLRGNQNQQSPSSRPSVVYHQPVHTPPVHRTQTLSFRGRSRTQSNSEVDEIAHPRLLQIREQNILDWANQKLAGAGYKSRIRSFRDPCIAQGVCLLELLMALRHDAVDPRYVTPGSTEKERQSNAQYVVSIARKVGCTLFLVWEDIVEVHPRMILVLLASLMCLDRKKLRQGESTLQLQEEGHMSGLSREVLKREESR